MCSLCMYSTFLVLHMISTERKTRTASSLCIVWLIIHHESFSCYPSVIITSLFVMSTDQKPIIEALGRLSPSLSIVCSKVVCSIF